MLGAAVKVYWLLRGSCVNFAMEAIHQPFSGSQLPLSEIALAARTSLRAIRVPQLDHVFQVSLSSSAVSISQWKQSSSPSMGVSWSSRRFVEFAIIVFVLGEKLPELLQTRALPN